MTASDQKNSTAVSFDKVSVDFEDKTVHQDLCFSIAEGESVTFLGPSGTGKTVVLRLIVGLLKPSSGRVHVFGENITEYSEEELHRIRNEVGFLFQGAALFDSISVYENVAYPLRQQGNHSEEFIESKVIEKLRVVGLESTKKQFPAELSGGQKKRIGLARALATEPKLMLFDEPTTGLDPTSVRRIDDLIVELNEELGITTLSVTHDIASARRISKRWILLADGTIQADGLFEQLEQTARPVQDFVQGRWSAEL